MMSNFTLSAYAKKANKKTAYQMVEQLKQGETLSPDQIGSLLLYFAPSLPKTAVSPLQWVAKAVGKKEIRYYLNYIRVQDGKAYGTDGVRLHVAKVDLPEGWYCPRTLVLLTDIDANAPDYSRLIARTQNKITTSTLGELTKSISKNETRLTHEQLQCSASQRLLVEALNSQDDNITFEYEQYNSSYRLRGQHEFGEWVLMPLRQ